MNNDILPRSFFSMPAATVPSFFEDIDELIPSSNLFNGLSISEDDKKVYVEAAMPGLDAKEIDVSFDKGVLSIRGDKNEEEKGKRYQRRATQSFHYRVALEEIDSKSEPEAEYKNGIMTITFVKAKESKPKKIAVKAA